MGKINAKRTGEHSFLARLAPPVLLLFVLGCANNNRQPTSAAGDPLNGAVPLGSGGPTASAVPAPTPIQPQVPPIPVPGSSQSLAALASGGEPKPLDPNRDPLRIAVPASNPNSGPPKAVLLPASATAPPTLQPVARGVAPAGAPAATFEQAQAFLKARGVKWQCLQTWGDQGAWKFSCSIPNPKNQYISRTYEAQARDNISAVQAVIDQIERDAASGF